MGSTPAPLLAGVSNTVVTFFSQLLFSRPPFLLLHVHRFEQTTHTIAPLLWDAFVTVTLCRVLASVSPGFAICFPRQLTSEGSRARAGCSGRGEFLRLGQSQGCPA